MDQLYREDSCNLGMTDHRLHSCFANLPMTSTGLRKAVIVLVDTKNKQTKSVFTSLQLTLQQFYLTVDVENDAIKFKISLYLLSHSPR